MNKLLEIQHLKVDFYSEEQTIHSVDDVSFHIKEGETLGIVGESGSGKSVTAFSIMQLLPQKISRITEGEIRYKNQNLLSLKEKEMRKIRGNDIAIIFQEPMTSLNPTIKVGRQITETLKAHTKLNKKQRLEQTVLLLKKVGIARAEQLVDAYPYELSGGMRQRVMIAIALACQPSLLIADEPTTALDTTVQAQILDLLKHLKDEESLSTLLITHDLGVVSEVCNRVIVMYAGRIIEEFTIQNATIEPLHPYTQGLIAAVPKIGERLERLQVNEERVKLPVQQFKGCKYAARCPYAESRCYEEEPKLQPISATHQVRCFAVKEGAYV